MLKLLLINHESFKCAHNMHRVEFDNGNGFEISQFIQACSIYKDVCNEHITFNACHVACNDLRGPPVVMAELDRTRRPHVGVRVARVSGV